MGVTGHQHILVTVALCHEFLEEDFHLFGNLAQLGTGEQFEVEQHLVVARTSAMYLFTHVAQLAGEHEFHLRVYVLHTLFDNKFATFSNGVDILQFGQQHLQFVGGQQADALQHGDVSHGAQHVVLGQIEVHFAVASDGEPFNLFVYLYVLFPEFLSHNILMC